MGYRLLLCSIAKESIKESKQKQLLYIYMCTIHLKPYFKEPSGITTSYNRHGTCGEIPATNWKKCHSAFFSAECSSTPLHHGPTLSTSASRTTAASVRRSMITACESHLFLKTEVLHSQAPNELAILYYKLDHTTLIFFRCLLRKFVKRAFRGIAICMCDFIMKYLMKKTFLEISMQDVSLNHCFSHKMAQKMPN